MSDLISNNKENDFIQSPFKVIPLLVLEVVFAFLMSFYFRQLLTNGIGLGWFLVGFFLFITFSFLSALFLNKMLWSSLAAGLSVIASFVVFYDYFSTVLIISGIFIFLIFVWGIRELKLEIENTLKINFFRLVKVFLNKITLGLAIMFCVFGYFLLPTGSGFPVSFKNFQAYILKPNEPIIGIFVPNFKFETSIQKALINILEPQIIKQIPNYKDLPAAARETILESVIRQQFLDGLEKSSGVKINAQEPVGKIIYDFLVIKFNQLNESIKNLITLGIFVILFFVIQTIFIPVKWLLSFVLFLVYMSLLAVRFAGIRLEQRSKEVLHL
jgi:hypothetical protein